MGNHIILDREYIFRLTQGKEEKDLIELRKLHAHAQLIGSIDVNAFRSLINLKILDISHNYLTFIDPLVFKPLINLEKIKLQNNKLTSIDPFIFKNLKNLRKIHLYWNKLSNECLELFLEPSVQYVSFRSDGFIKNDIKLIVG
jgi:Leucine-rich repeat (LRR) protein